MGSKAACLIYVLSISKTRLGLLLALGAQFVEAAASGSRREAGKAYCFACA
jgi:hypothetical protein